MLSGGSERQGINYADDEEQMDKRERMETISEHGEKYESIKRYE